MRNTTIYDLQKEVRASLFEWGIPRILEEDDDEVVYEIIESVIPIYTADTLSVALSNLSIAGHCDADMGYTDNATPIEIMKTNIFEELVEYVHNNLQDWITECKEGEDYE